MKPSHVMNKKLLHQDVPRPGNFINKVTKFVGYWMNASEVINIQSQRLTFLPFPV